MARKSWNLDKLNKAYAAEIAEKFSLDPFSALLISQRGFSSDEEIRDFLGKDTELCDPFLLPDMEIAVERINDAIFDNEKICVYGDYDCDGVTATTLLYSYLDIQGADVFYMLPDRIGDGYGLHNNVIDKIKAEGTSLIITVDNGISAIEEAKYIKELGMDLIVTDHHLPGDELPDCIAVVDPHRDDSECPFCDYAGVGVAFKLCCAIEGDDDSIINGFADIVAIGTIADIVPLRGENRTLVRLGLYALNNSVRKPGIDALLYVTGLGDKQILSSNISFGIGPRINAAGRMGSAEEAIKLLISDDLSAVSEMADKLNNVNNDRHSAEGKILDECISITSAHKIAAHNPVLVVYGDGWHEGVLGIVASKLLDRYCRPAIVLSNKDGISKGSARSIEGFSMFDALSACSDCLEVFGGHAQAAGLTIKTERIPEFIEAINEYARGKQPFYPSVHVDCKLNTDGINLNLLDSIKMLEPFGAENPLPVFGIYDLTIDGINQIGDNKQHLKIYAHKEGKQNQIALMYFNASATDFPYKLGDKFDALVALDKNEWNGVTRVSIIIKNTRPAGTDDDIMVKSEIIYDKAILRNCTREEASFAIPGRPLFARLYKYLKTVGGNYSNYEYIAYKVAEDGDNLCKTRIAMLAMRQLGLIDINDVGVITVPHTENKFDLGTAPIMMYLKEVSSNG